MANFIVVIDQNPDRRSQYIKTIQPLLPPVDGLITNSCVQGEFHAIWAASSNAPISWSADQEGAAIVWGDAIKQNESARIDAGQLKKLWKEISPQGLPCFDGFHAIVVYHPDFGLTVSADILGIFPVYYFIYNQVVLVGSSPELFRYHPLFKAKFNPAGLVGILLTNGLFNGETLWQGVRRLDAGHSLVWQRETTPKEVKQYEISAISSSDVYSDLTFSEYLDFLEHLVDKTLQRQAPANQKHSLLLSGGLDSRMLAGFLHRQGVDLVALTLGKRTDIEMQCAIPVAQTLGLEHHKLDINLAQFPLYADLLIKWEHLANGFNFLMDWGIYSYIRELAPKVIVGNSIELVIGGKGAYAISTNNLSFDQFFDQGVNNWGLSAQILERLLCQTVFGSLVQETLAKIQIAYNQYSPIEFKRSLYFDLYHRQRFHVSSIGWQLTFGSWPVMPILSMQLLKSCATLPIEMVAQRKLQKELVCTRFPKLAELPIDRNNYNVEPLLSDKNRSAVSWSFGLQRRWRRIQEKLGYERRYYYRILDINNPGWKEIRNQAEPYRERTYEFFNKEVLNELLPSSKAPILFNRDAITESSGLKALVGFLLWSRHNL